MGIISFYLLASNYALYNNKIYYSSAAESWDIKIFVPHTNFPLMFYNNLQFSSRWLFVAICHKPVVLLTEGAARAPGEVSLMKHK